MKYENCDIVFVKPRRFEDCARCIEHIKNDKIVHLNLAGLDPKDSQRILDYISGAVYIKEAEIVNPGESIFCSIPRTKSHLFEYKLKNDNIDEEEEIKPVYKK